MIQAMGTIAALFLAGCHLSSEGRLVANREPEAQYAVKGVLSTYTLADLMQCFGSPHMVRPLGKFRIVKFAKSMCSVQATLDGEHVLTVDARLVDAKVCFGHLRRSCRYP